MPQWTGQSLHQSPRAWRRRRQVASPPGGGGGGEVARITHAHVGGSPVQRAPFPKKEASPRPQRITTARRLASPQGARFFQRLASPAISRLHGAERAEAWTALPNLFCNLVTPRKLQHHPTNFATLAPHSALQYSSGLSRPSSDHPERRRGGRPSNPATPPPHEYGNAPLRNAADSCHFCPFGPACWCGTKSERRARGVTHGRREGHRTRVHTFVRQKMAALQPFTSSLPSPRSVR